MPWRNGRGALLWFTLALAIALTPVVIAQEDAPPTLATRDDAALGSILVDPSGWTLYTFAGDGPETSACTGPCLAVWPPLVVDGDVAAPAGIPGTISAFPRDDGTMQAAYNFAPLYYYSGDVQPGDANGQGVGGRWFAAASGLTPASRDQPAPAPVTQPTAPPAPTSVPAAAPTGRPTPPLNQAAPTAAPAPTSAPAPTAVPYHPPPRMGY